MRLGPVVMAVASLWAPVALDAQTDFLAEGDKAFDAKEFDRAIELYSKAAQADPKDPAPEFQLALTYNSMNRDGDAVSHYKAALALQPDLYEAQLNLGLTLLRMKQPEAALPYLESAAEKKSTAASESGVARALARSGKLAESEPHFRKAAELDAHHREDILELAALYEAVKEPQKAVAIYKEFPDEAGAQEHLGMLLSAGTGGGDDKQAIVALEAAVSKSPTGANRIALAQAYLRTNQPQKAEAMAAQAVAAQPEDHALRMFYGRILRDERKFPQAAAQFAAAAEAKPESADAWNELSSVYILSEQYPQALAALDRVNQLGGASAGYYFFRAIALDHLQQRLDAVGSYKKFLAMSGGKLPDQEFQARQRIRILENEMKKK